MLGPWQGTEFYANAGYGYHSNDARGATITRDPNSGEPVDRVTPLARRRGAEVGVRTVAIPHLQTTFTLWTLGLDSELLFVGDAGTTEAGRPSRRTGVEWANYYRPMPWLTFDADVVVARAVHRRRSRGRAHSWRGGNGGVPRGDGGSGRNACSAACAAIFRAASAGRR